MFFNISRSQSQAEAGPSTPRTTSQILPTAVDNLEFPAPPAPVVVANTRRSREEETTNVFDDFFGVTRTSSERRAASLESTTIPSRPSTNQPSPPPYPYPAAEDDLPTYEQTLEQEDEPTTLARFLYKCGFCTSSFNPGSLHPSLTQPLDS